jgi:DNA-binding NtrC family response regulator
MVIETMASTSASSTAAPPGSSALDEASMPESGPLLNKSQAPHSPSAFSSSELEDYPSLHGLTGRSPAMRRLIQQMRRMAPHLTLATIEGEEGTGRTLAARALHAAGPAQEGPFIPCPAAQFFAPENPAAVTASTDTFDRHQRWSSTVLRSSHNGMLFLDRVHQLSRDQQELLADFLHWFDDHQFRARHSLANAASAHHASDRPGREDALPAQIVFSTSVSLRDPNGVARFREDLASRLCSVRFHLPPLAQRREDIPLLAQVFIQRFARIYGKPVRGLGPGTIAPLLRHSWPRNVRELEETINVAALETESQWIRPIDLPPLTATARHVHSAEGNADDDFNLDQAIRNHVTRVLARTRGNKLRAAQLLGISRSTLYRILAASPGEHPEAQNNL